MVEKRPEICDKEADDMVERFVINPKPIKSRKRKKASKSQERFPKKKRASCPGAGVVTNSISFVTLFICLIERRFVYGLFRNNQTLHLKGLRPYRKLA